MGINIFSAFDGISCGQIAVNNIGLEYDNYYSSEIDRFATGITQYNFPNTKQVGDITRIKGEDYPNIDLLMGGSPCQGFSFAGKQLNFNDPRSKLFFEFARLKNEMNPKYFLLENVVMRKEYQHIISEYMGVEPILIDSAIVSAQHRRRLYWTNIPILPIEDKDIFLRNIIDGEHKELTINEKISSLIKDVDWYEIDEPNNTVVLQAKNGKKVYINLLMEAPYAFYETRTELGKEARRQIRKEFGKDSNPRSKDHKKYVPRLENKANCLLTCETPLDYIIDWDWKYRRLSVTEWERLQTLPNNYTSSASDNQRKKMIGNGWTINVISNILKGIKDNL